MEKTDEKPKVLMLFIIHLARHPGSCLIESKKAIFPGGKILDLITGSMMIRPIFIII